MVSSCGFLESCTASSCWWPDDVRTQGISSYVIDLTILEYSAISTTRVRLGGSETDVKDWGCIMISTSHCPSPPPSLPPTPPPHQHHHQHPTLPPHPTQKPIDIQGSKLRGAEVQNAPKLSPNAPRLLNLGAKFCYPIQPDICFEA